MHSNGGGGGCASRPLERNLFFFFKQIQNTDLSPFIFGLQRNAGLDGLNNMTASFLRAYNKCNAVGKAMETRVVLIVILSCS